MIRHKKGFACSFLPVARMPATKAPKGVVQLRAWQDECAADFVASELPHGIVNAPTGSGKSKAISYISSCRIQDEGKKIIIAVPQKNIGGGFEDHQKFQLFDGSVIDYRVSKNLCNDLSDKSKKKELIAFLRDEACVTLSDHIVICTHQTLAYAFQALSDDGELFLLDNTMLWVDEAHHILNADNDVSNKIGAVAKYYLKNSDRGLSINLATATLFRGDKASIIPKEFEEEFTRYNLPYDRHFEENCQGLSFSYDFLLHDKSWFEALKSAFKERVGKTIVFIPSPTHGASSGHGKHEEVKQVLYAIAGRKNCKIEEDANGVLHVNRKGEIISVIDVVAEGKKRDKRLDYIRKNPDSIDVVIGIGVPKEGFDWPCADREIIIGQRRSLNELIQMMGRTFRYHPDKAGGENKVEIIQVLPWVDQKKLDKGQLRDQLNDFMKAVYATLILESVMNPVDIDVPTTKKSEKKGKKVNIVLEYIKSKIGDEEYIGIWENIIDALIDYRNEHPEIAKDKFDEEYGFVIRQELEQTSIDSFHEEISKMILGSFKRRTSDVIKSLKESLSGIDVSHIDFDIINEYDPLGFVVGYTNELCGVVNLRDYRNSIACDWDLQWMESYEAVLDFTSKENKLPSNSKENSKEKTLYIWCKNQKVSKIKKENRIGIGRLSLEKERMLESIPGWIWAQDEKWMENYKKVLDFVKENNNFPSYKADKEKEARLGRWCGSQKTAKKGKKGKMTPERESLLESIPGWEWEDNKDEKWMENYRKVLAFVKENRKIPPNTSGKGKVSKLGRWISIQRMAKKNKGNTKMTPERESLLESIPGWEWEDNKDEKWMENYRELLEFVKTKKRIPIRRRVALDEKEQKLGIWCATQRQVEKGSMKGEMSPERKKLLESIPNWFWSK